MNEFKRMKIAFGNVSDYTMDVTNVLHNLGYKFCGDAEVYRKAKGFFTYESGIIMKTDDRKYFNEHPNDEYVLVGDELKKVKDYYKQPSTAYIPAPPDGTEAFIAKQKAVADNILHKLFPIDPFAIVAGGAPRDWHFGKPATDLDIFFYNPVEQLTIVTEMLRHVGINLVDDGRSGTDIPEWYKLNPDLKCVYSVEVDGVKVQLMLMQYKTQDTVVPKFPFSICKAWYKHGSITLEKDFKSCERHKIVVQTNKLYSDEHKYVQKMKGKFPDWNFFDSWEAAYKYVFEKGSV